jgi:hypothetical protein
MKPTDAPFVYTVVASPQSVILIFGCKSHPQPTELDFPWAVCRPPLLDAQFAELKVGDISIESLPMTKYMWALQ